MQFFEEMANFVSGNPDQEAKWRASIDKLQEDIRAGRVDLNESLVRGGHGKVPAEPAKTSKKHGAG